jgi:2-iminoacetate synthase ThiH
MTMSESVLERLRRETRKKEVERKAEAFKREYIEKEKAEQSSINLNNLCRTTCFMCTYSTRN